MATYVALVNWTEQGAKNAKDSVEFAQGFRKDLERRGGKLHSILWTQGRYDIILMFETPSDETAMAALLAVCGLGSFRTETLRAYTENEMASILQKV